MEALLKEAPATSDEFSFPLPVLNTPFVPVHHDQAYISHKSSRGTRHFQLRYSTFLGLCAKPDIAPEIARRATAEGIASLTEDQDCRSCRHYNSKLKKGKRGTIPLIIGKPGVAAQGCSYSPSVAFAQTRPVLDNLSDDFFRPDWKTIDLRTSCAYPDIQADVLLSGGLLEGFETYRTSRHLSARTYFGFDKKPGVFQRLISLLPQ